LFAFLILSAAMFVKIELSCRRK